MKILLSWLKDYILTDLSAKQIAETLSDVGFPCESLEFFDNDAVIDVEVTSNRGDCLSYIGIARELAAATGKELKMPAVELDESQKAVTEFVSVEILEPDLCGRYTARIIEGVKVGPSPDWMRKRLEAVGLRSVNNVVDATNYVMMETGQPPHAFDYAKIAEGKIIVRKAIAGQRIVSIDGATCDLDPDMLIIADARSAVAIAGVMGGLETEVGEATTTILLEDAYFEPVTVRRTSRKLALPSDAAFRFERIVDIEKVDWASKRTCMLITQVAGGRVVKGVVDVYPKPKTQINVTLRLSRPAKLLGIEVPVEEVIRSLLALGFQPKRSGDNVICLVPSWRSDIYREVDLIEELSRLYGYDKIPTEQKIQIQTVPMEARQKLTQSVGTYLNGCGFYETITVGFVDGFLSELFTADGDGLHLAVKDESRKSANKLRRTLFGSLLGVLKTNLNAKNLPCRIFEIADTFVPTDEDVLPVEKTMLALVCDSNLRYMRGAIDGLIRSINRQVRIEYKPVGLVWAEAAAEVIVNGKVIGTAGIFSQAVKDKFDFGELSPTGAELELEQLMSLQAGPIKVKPIPKFPAVQRDLSIVVDEQVSWADLVRVVEGTAPDALEDIRFVDIYRGRGIPSGRKSVTLSLCFRDEQGTLTHETVDRFQADILEALAESVRAELRAL